MTYYASRPLQIAPFIEIVQVPDNGGNRIPMSLEPELAATPRQTKFSRSLTHGAFVYDVRRELTPGIGNPNESVPEGIRVFSPDDQYLLFGGSATSQAAMYRRVGPTYQAFPVAVLPTAPTYVTHAVLTKKGAKLILVTSNDPNNAKVYGKTGSTYALEAAIASPSGAVSSIELTPEIGEFVVHGTDSHKIVSFGGSVVASPAGRLLAMSPDSEFYVIDTLVGADAVKVYNRAGTTFTLHSEAPGTAGTNRNARFSPDSEVLEVSGRFSASGQSPTFFALYGGAFTLTGGVPRAGLANLVDNAGSFAKDSGRMAYGYSLGGSSFNVDLFDRTTVTHAPINKLPDPATLPPGDGYGVSYSNDGAHLAVGSATAPYLTIYKRNGNTFDKLPDPTNLPPGGVGALRFSNDGIYLAVAHANSPLLTIYKRTGDTFAKLPNPSVLPSVSAWAVTWTADGTYLAVAFRGSPYRIVYKRTGDTFAAVTFPAPASGGESRAIAFSPDGNHLAVARAEAPFLDVYSRSGDVFTRLPNQATMPTSAVEAIAFSPDSTLLVLGTGSAPRVLIYEYSGANFVKRPDPADLPTGSVTGIAFSDDGFKVAISYLAGERLILYDRSGVTFTKRANPAALPTGSGRDLDYSPDGTELAVAHIGAPYVTIYRQSPPAELPTYVLAFTDSGTGSLQPKLSFAPNGEILHYLTDHIATASPLATVNPLPFDGDFPSHQITNVQYSPTGRGVIYDTPDGPSVAVQTASQDYIKLSKLNGTFISLYEREEGNILTEQGFIAHAKDADVTNLAFSFSPKFFSYFSLNTTPDPDSTQGRHVYDMSLRLMGVEYDPLMERSFIAFSPFEEYFAATYSMTDLNHPVVLYKVAGGSAYSYSEVDRRPVAFGPLDFSSCEDVIVAHGGEVNPFTLFKRDGDVLVQKDYPTIDWNHGGIIIDIATLPDCSVVVITPDKIITVDKDDDKEELTVEDEDEFETPIGPDTGLELDDDGDTAIVGGGWGGGGGGGGGWGVGPGGGLTDLNYIPYASVHVHYRRA